MSSKAKGRPVGATNVRDTADAMPSACPKCGSTKRGPYLDRHVRAYTGLMNGQPYTHIVRRRVRCADCAQMRIDRTFENWPDGPPDEAGDEK